MRCECVGKLGLVCAVLFLSVGDFALSILGDSDDWEVLFDGESTSAWRAVGTPDFPSDAWVVEEDCLRLLPNRPDGRDLITLNQYTDFELRFDWKVSEGGNSGIKYAVQESKRPSTGVRLSRWGLAVGTGCMVLVVVLSFIAYRVRGRLIIAALVGACGLSLLSYHAVLSGERDSGKAIGLEFQLYDDRDIRVPNKTASSGALYDLIAPAQNAVIRRGGFNSGRIIVKGLNVEHWINGDKILDYELGSEFLRRRIAGSKFRKTSGFGVKTAGHIALQNHRDEAWFRDIRIRRIFLEPLGDSVAE